MKLRSIFAGLVLGTAFSAPAVAADLYQPAPAPTYFSGFYVGGGVGGAYTLGDIDASGYGYILNGKPFADDGGFYFEDEYTGQEFGFMEYDCGQACGYGIFGATSLGNGYNSEVISEILGSLFGLVNGPPIDELAGSGRGNNGTANVFGRIETGYDFRFDGSPFVVGLNAGFDFGDATIRQDAAGFGAGIVGSDSTGPYVAGGGALTVLETELKVKNSWSVGARAGWVVMDSGLLFVSGGYQQTNATLSAFHGMIGAAGDGFQDTNAIGATEVSSKNSEWLDGWYVGGGLEMMVTNNISAKLEYRYSDLGSISTENEVYDSVGCGDCGAGYEAGAGVGAKADLTRHTVAGTVAFRF